MERKTTEQAQAAATVIGPGSTFQGDLRCADSVEIRGTLEGDCRTSARCVVHEGGRVLGNIEAAALLVAGQVEAGLLRADKVELRASAHVVGAISARMIVIADGAFFKGDIENTESTSGPPILKDQRTGEP